ncbi:type I glyceraldehyde-3-phosphate dehydrogenase [Candidatus Peregrinibacteria bacterium CG_4_10_14_0_2_um_filter_43_11]|nr:MAG: type I glyceraldehyde-3-phosphate dehydrogenase [Candidatus Peregrinibacteria bacterium CG_4_10_14_0_2_um_filter_43_11]
MIKIGLNGYGRIGRNVHRLLLGHPELRVVAINARSEDTKMRAHLLKYDSLHGKLENDIHYANGTITIDGNEVRCFAVKDASEVPWTEAGVDIVLECTGKAKTYDIAARHLETGVKKVVVSAPMNDDTPTFVIGVNEKDLKSEYHVVSNASCTTNCIAPPMKLIHEKWGILNAFVSSIHSFTHSQNLLDNSGRDLRRARSAVQSVIPTTTGAVSTTGKIIPELNGKLDGMAYRVPIATSSVCDIVLHLEKPTTKEEMNQFFREIAKDPYFDSIIDICDEPLVSIDFKTNPHSSIIDTDFTQVTNGNYVKLLAWYDNEWGYANRLVDLMGMISKNF